MARCPECEKPAEARFAPFCSTRCQQVDLGRWLTGRYVIPGRDGDAPVPGTRPQAGEDEE